MLNHPMVDDYDLSSVTNALIGAAPVDEAATKSFREKFPNISLTQGKGISCSTLMLLYAFKVFDWLLKLRFVFP